MRLKPPRTATAWAAPLGCAGVLALAWSRGHHPPRTGVGDFYPLYHGARALLSSGDAYSLDPNLPDLGPVSQVGNAYPLHAVILGIPFSWMSPVVAGAAWITVVGLAWIGAICWARESWAWLLWWPAWEALRVGQATAAMVVASIVAVGSIRRDRRTPFVLAILVLSMKPQQTLLLVIGLVWTARRWWRELLVATALASLGTLLLQPGWPAAWIHSVQRYQGLQDVEGMVTPALVLLAIWLAARGWRESSLVVASNALAPWPTAAHYNAAIWPIGLSDRESAAAAMTAAVGFVAALLTPLDWAFPLMLVLSMAVAALAFPRTARDGPVTEDRKSGLRVPRLTSQGR